MIKLYPDPVEVFSSSQTFLERSFLPILFIDHKSSRTGISIKLPIVIPIEPVDGYIGDYTREYHSYYCRENWVGFSINTGFLELLADKRYLQLESYESERDIPERINQHYNLLRRSYRDCVSYFKERGYIPDSWYAENEQPSNDFMIPCYKSGEYPDAGNWSDSVEGPNLSRKMVIDAHGHEIEAVTPLSETGNEFEYVGWFNGWDYVKESQVPMIVFYEPLDKIILCTFDWS